VQFTIKVAILEYSFIKYSQEILGVKLLILDAFIECKNRSYIGMGASTLYQW
jgi:hypothetical protein